MRFAYLPFFAATLTFAAADVSRGQSAESPVMEIVTFRLLPGISDADFLAAAQGTQALVAAQPGFVSRSLLHDDTGVWTDIIRWQSLPQALTAAQSVMAEPTFAPFAGSIDMTSISMRHVPVLWHMSD
jgi:hypothetical protein